VTIDNLLIRLDQMSDVPEETRSSIRGFAHVAQINPRLALVALRNALESIMRDVWVRKLPDKPIGRTMLDGMLNGLRSGGYLPERQFALGSNVKNLGNLGAHPNDSQVHVTDVGQSLGHLI